jgi:hypothetical protein
MTATTTANTITITTTTTTTTTTATTTTTTTTAIFFLSEFILKDQPVTFALIFGEGVKGLFVFVFCFWAWGQMGHNIGPSYSRTFFLDKSNGDIHFSFRRCSFKFPYNLFFTLKMAKIPFSLLDLS